MEEKKNKSTIVEIIKETIIAFAIAVAFAVFVGQPVVVQGQSMENTYHDEQYLFNASPSGPKPLRSALQPPPVRSITLPPLWLKS